MNRYPSDLTDKQWNLIKDFIPKAKKGGRPRTTDERQAINGIFYLVRTGCQWRMLPDTYPPWQTVYRYFALLRKCGAVRKLHRKLYIACRILHERTKAPSAVVIDSQSVKTGKAGGPRGFDGGKRVKGRKRHVVVDTLGLMVDVVVTPANIHDISGGIKVYNRVRSWLPGRPTKIFADKGYQGSRFKNWARYKYGAHVHVTDNPAMVTKHFVPVKKRWVVERTFGWFGNYRRLEKDQERKIVHSTAMIRWSMIMLTLNRLAPG